MLGSEKITAVIIACGESMIHVITSIYPARATRTEPESFRELQRAPESFRELQRAAIDDTEKLIENFNF